MKLIDLCLYLLFRQNFSIILTLCKNKFLILLNIWSMRLKSSVDIDQWKSLVSIQKFWFRTQRWWFTLQRNICPFGLLSY